MKNMGKKIFMGAMVVGAIALSTNFATTNTKASEDSYVDGIDHQFMYIAENSEYSVAKGKQEYYVMKDGYLYTGDTENMELEVLCDEPGCKHNKSKTLKEEMECKGYFLASNFLAYYDGSLYITHRDATKDIKKLELLKLSLDGKDREVIYTFDKTPTDIAIHRGQMYYSVRDDINSSDGMYIQRHILNTVKLGDEKATQLYKGDLDREEVIEDIKCYGKYIYFTVRSYKDDEITSKQMYYDTVTNAVERIHSDDDKDIVSNVQIAGDKILYTVCNPLPEDDCTYEEYRASFKHYRANLDGSGIEDSFLNDVNGSVLGDGKNFVVDLADEDRNKYESIGIQIYSPEGKFIGSIYTDYFEGIGRIMPGDEEKLFIINRVCTDTPTITAVDKKKLMQNEFDKKLLLK